MEQLLADLPRLVAIGPDGYSHGRRGVIVDRHIRRIPSVACPGWVWLVASVLYEMAGETRSCTIIGVEP